MGLVLGCLRRGRDLPYGESGEVFTVPRGDGVRMVISAGEQLWQRLGADKPAESGSGESVGR